MGLLKTTLALNIEGAAIVPTAAAPVLSSALLLNLLLINNLPVRASKANKLNYT